MVKILGEGNHEGPNVSPGSAASHDLRKAVHCPRPQLPFLQTTGKRAPENYRDADSSVPSSALAGSKGFLNGSCHSNCHPHTLETGPRSGHIGRSR